MKGALIFILCLCIAIMALAVIYGNPQDKPFTHVLQVLKVVVEEENTLTNQLTRYRESLIDKMVELRNKLDVETPITSTNPLTTTLDVLMLIASYQWYIGLVLLYPFTAILDLAIKAVNVVIIIVTG